MVGLGAIARKLFGSANDRRIKGYHPIVAAINALEEEISQLSDEELRNKTAEFKKTTGRGYQAQRSSGASLCHRTRGRQTHARSAPL